MHTETLDEILCCPALPSLPAVAAKVIELTSDENVRIEDLATTIQNDQALSAKILRTVNSSFYGLRQKCASIQKALVLLGLGPVKSLALGFSLVSTLHDTEDTGMDWTDYWRRGMNTAVAARLCAIHVNGADPDVAFLGGLIQDIGMVATYRAMKDEYISILEACEGDHRKLARHELSRLEIQHPEIGAMLAQRWRLPTELVIPVRYHERPSAAPNTHAELVRLVGLGNMVHDTLVAEDPSIPIRKFYTRAKEWFKLDSETCQQVLRDAAEASSDMAKVLSLDTGAKINADEVIAIAEERLAEMAVGNPEDVIVSRTTAEMMKKHKDVDASSGVLGRKALYEISESAFGLLQNEDEPFSVVHILVVSDARADQNHKVADVHIGVIALLRKFFEPCGGVICRIRDDLFTVAIPGCDRFEAVSLAKAFSSDFARFAGRRREDMDQFRISGSIGFATANKANVDVYQGGEQVILAALQAVRSAARGTPFTVREFVPAEGTEKAA